MMAYHTSLLYWIQILCSIVLMSPLKVICSCVKKNIEVPSSLSNHAIYNFDCVELYFSWNYHIFLVSDRKFLSGSSSWILLIIFICLQFWIKILIPWLIWSVFMQIPFPIDDFCWIELLIYVPGLWSFLSNMHVMLLMVHVQNPLIICSYLLFATDSSLNIPVWLMLIVPYIYILGIISIDYL